MKIVYVDMVADFFHWGHVNFLKKAKKFGDLLYVGIHNDKDIESYKRKPIMNMNERKIVLKSCKYVDKVILNAPLSITKEHIKKHNIDLVVHAHNKDEDDKYYFMYKIPIELGIFKRIDYTPKISTSNIILRIMNS